MMTFEEYKQLALNPPEQRENSLFVVQCITIDELEEGKRQHYPCYKISDGKRAYCRTLEEAVDCVKRQVEEYEKKDKDRRKGVFCYYVWEYPWETKLYEGEFNAFSWRMYDATGQLIDKHVCAGKDWRVDESHDTYSNFRGRSEELIRFKEGDIVEMVYRGEVILGFVVSVPPSIEWVWERTKRCVEEYRNDERYKQERSDEEIIDRFACDISDDCYIVLTTSDYASHHHVHTTDVFAPHFPVPNYMRKKLENSYRVYKEKMKKWEEKNR